MPCLKTVAAVLAAFVVGLLIGAFLIGSPGGGDQAATDALVLSGSTAQKLAQLLADAGTAPEHDRSLYCSPDRHRARDHPRPLTASSP